MTETLKWSSPAFEYKGLLCGMAGFKRHCVFGFWKHALLFTDAEAAARPRAEAAQSGERDVTMGQFGRIRNMSDLPSDRVLRDLVRRVVALNEAGVKVPRKVKSKPALVVPKDLAAALRSNPASAATFKGFSESKRRDYVEWLTEAKTPATRERRLATPSSGWPRASREIGSTSAANR